MIIVKNPSDEGGRDGVGRRRVAVEGSALGVERRALAAPAAGRVLRAQHDGAALRRQPRVVPRAMGDRPRGAVT